MEFDNNLDSDRYRFKKSPASKSYVHQLGAEHRDEPGDNATRYGLAITGESLLPCSKPLMNLFTYVSGNGPN